LAEIYLHDTSSGCCDHFFGRDAAQCTPKDICVTDATTVSSEITDPSATTTKSSETTGDVELTCKSSYWHPHLNGDGCSNSLDYPPEWDEVPGMLLSTSQACCDFFLKERACNIYQVCEEVEIVPDETIKTDFTCVSNVWHPDMVNMDGCSNSLDFPQMLSVPGSKYVFENSLDCCAAFFNDVTACNIYQICEDGPPSMSCTSNAWHPDMTNRNGCSNSVDNIPPDWDSKFFFNNSQDCCDFFFSGEDCAANKVCDEGTTSSDSETTTITTVLATTSTPSKSVSK
jgi:hypothetical protein